MNSRKWRNPYTPINKKMVTQTATNVSLSVTPTPKKIVPAVDLRTSVSRMRNNIKDIGSTMRQVEATMDTLYGAMELFETIGKGSSKPAAQTKTVPRRPAVENTDDEDITVDSSSSVNNPLANIDISQLLGLLQSPLVQSLLNQSTGGGKRKKEG